MASASAVHYIGHNCSRVHIRNRGQQPFKKAAMQGNLNAGNTPKPTVGSASARPLE